MRHGFWVGGSSEYAAELDRQYQAEVRALRNRLRNAESIHEEEAARQQIAELRVEYRVRRRDISRSMF